MRTCPELAELLLAAGTEIDARDEERATILHSMANKPRPDAVAWLLAHQADPNARMADGRTPLHRAAGRNGGTRVVKMLIEAGADPTARDSNKMTALDYAEEKNKTKVATYLSGLRGVRQTPGDSTGDSIARRMNGALRLAAARCAERSSRAQAEVEDVRMGMLARVFATCDAALAKTPFVVNLGRMD